LRSRRRWISPVCGGKTNAESRKSILENIKDEAAKIREYVRMYETAPEMGIPDVSKYRRMAEYGNTVLAGMYSEKRGFMFTTWRQSADKTSVAHGDYTPNFDYAKESFVTRSGLIDRHRFFTEDEAADKTSSVTQLITNSDKPLRFESPPNSLSRR
jgi:hypothetical protein